MSLATPAGALHILQIEDTTGVDVILTRCQVRNRFMVGQHLECFDQRVVFVRSHHHCGRSTVSGDDDVFVHALNLVQQLGQTGASLCEGHYLAHRSFIVQNSAQVGEPRWTRTTFPIRTRAKQEFESFLGRPARIAAVSNMRGPVVPTPQYLGATPDGKLAPE